MTDTDILRKALERYRNATANNTAFKDDVIVFLEKEIDQYREKLEDMECDIERMKYNADQMNEEKNKLKERLNAIYGEQCAAAIKEQLGDTVQTLTTFSEDRTSDGGAMTLSRTTAKWKLVAECLLENGYFVTSHFDDKNSEDKTITIEFWRA